jgi:hypothetical protein
MLPHHIMIESFTHKKTLYECAWSPYLLIMECYKFLGTPLKAHYVMAIQKLSMISYDAIMLHITLSC